MKQVYCRVFSRTVRNNSFEDDIWSRDPVLGNGSVLVQQPYWCRNGGLGQKSKVENHNSDCTVDSGLQALRGLEINLT